MILPPISRAVRFRMRPRLAVVTALAAIALSAPPAAAAPELSWIFPSGGQRGTTLLMEVHGTGLSRLTGLFRAGQGLTAEVVPLPLPPSPKSPGGRHPSRPAQSPGAGDTARTLRITIARDAPLGGQEVRLFDPDGVSNPRIFQVGQWPEVRETEPNDDPATANPIPTPCTVNGQIDHGSDQDCFRFHATAGEQVSCAVYSERLLANMGDSWLKGFLEVLAPNGDVLASNGGRFHWDPVICFTAPQTADYTARFHDLVFRGTPSAVYRLTIGPVPYAEAVFPAGGQRGTTARLVFIGLNLGPQPVESVSIPKDGRTLNVRFRTPTGETNELPIAIGDYPEVMEQEPNDTDAQAQSVPVPVIINGRMDRNGDRDCFRFHADANQALVLETLSWRLGSPMDTYLTLRDSQGKVLRKNDDALKRDSRIDFTAPHSGDFVVEVRDDNEQSGPEYTYRLTIRPPRPDFSLTATPDRLPVPANGASELHVHVDRAEGFDGPVRLWVDGMPRGLHASTAILLRGRSDAILTVEAMPTAGDAPATAGAGTPQAIRVMGAGTGGGRQITRAASAMETYNLQGTAFQRAVAGPVALAAPPGPLSLQTTAARLPLTAGASAVLDVRVQRAPGTAGPITLTLQNLPPGVTAAPATLAAGQDTAPLELKADEDAAAADQTLIVSASVKAPGGKDVQAIAPGVRLTVAEVPAFSLNAAPEELAFTGGKPATLKVALTRRGGFDGPVTLTVSGLPPGVVAEPARIDAGKSDATITLRQSPAARADATPAPAPPTPAATAPVAAPPAAAPKPAALRVQGTATVAGQLRTRLSEVVKLARPRGMTRHA